MERNWKRPSRCPYGMPGGTSPLWTAQASAPPHALSGENHCYHTAGDVRISGGDHPCRGEYAVKERVGALPEPESGRAPLRLVPAVGVATDEIHPPGNGRAGLYAADRLGKKSVAPLFRPGGQSYSRSLALIAHHHYTRPYPLRFGLSLPARCRAGSQPAKAETDTRFG